MRSHFRFSFFVVNAVAALLCATLLHAGGPQVNAFKAALANINDSLKLAQTELVDQAVKVDGANERLARIQEDFRKSGNKKAAQLDLSVLSSAVKFMADDHQSTDLFIESVETKLDNVAAQVMKHGVKSVMKQVAQSFELLKQTQDKSLTVGKAIEILRSDIQRFAEKIRVRIFFCDFCPQVSTTSREKTIPQKVNVGLFLRFSSLVERNFGEMTFT